MDIRLTGISKRFGAFVAVDGVDVGVRSGELLALLGPSGSGKTTLLRVIAGLEEPDAGTVEIGGAEANGVGVPDRGIGFVFQHYALFKHMTVHDNVGFALRMQKRPKAEVSARVVKLLTLFSLQGLAHRYPDQLSGGQRQRVALARALAAQPRILLLDEPFGALDAQVRQELRRWLRRLHDEIGVTTVFVTHDQEEALEVADRIVVMNKGRIEQTGTPEEVFARPANEFVMHFLGNVNVFHGRVEAGKAYVGEMVLGAPPHGAIEPAAARIYFRPHELAIERTSAGTSSFRARVTHVNPFGGRVKVELVTPGGETVIAELPRERYEELQLRRDMDVFVSPTDSTIFVEDYSI
ncbi:MAG TPA: sulfate/molybdate ABC transporter ATP-binding protein [Coriobacteriia bacterium]|jgi:sulfate transport system ATP-binding protein